MSNETFKLPGYVGQSRSLHLRDADKFEQEMATSQLAPSDEDTQDPENSVPEQPAHDWEKRYADLKSYSDKQIHAANLKAQAEEQKNLELQQQLKEAQSKSKSYPVSDEEIQNWAEQFPDFHKTLVTIVAKMQDEKAQELRKDMEQFSEAQKAYAAEKGWQELLKLHPDAEKLKTDSQFISWVERQSLEVQRLIQSPNPQTIARGIDLYKYEMNIKPVQKNNSDKEASKAITVNTKPETPKDKKVYSESEVAKMSPRTFLKYEKDIDLARAEGRFTYDLSSF